MTWRELLESRAFRRAGWIYVVYWGLVSGFFIVAFVDEWMNLPPAPPLGEQILLCVETATIFPVLVPGMGVTAGLHGGPLLERPPGFWILTTPMLVWAMIGWWTCGSWLWRWASGSRHDHSQSEDSAS